MPEEEHYEVSKVETIERKTKLQVIVLCCQKGIDTLGKLALARSLRVVFFCIRT